VCWSCVRTWLRAEKDAAALTRSMDLKLLRCRSNSSQSSKKEYGPKTDAIKCDLIKSREKWVVLLVSGREEIGRDRSLMQKWRVFSFL
jgi:hypothetical protein